MFGLSFITPIYIETFMLVFLRLAGWVIVSPIFGRKNLPGLLRIGLGLLLSIIIMMLIPIPSQSVNRNALEFFVNGVKEVVLGMTMGFISLVVFHLAAAAGQIMDMQIGFGMSNFFDPQLGTQMPISGSYLNAVLILMFFSVNGHHMLIGLLFESFSIISPGHVAFGAKFYELIISYFIWFTILVIKLALPIIAVSVILEVALGIIIKTMPQFNMFSIGIPMKIVLGIVSMVLFLSAFVFIIERGFDQMFAWHRKIIQGMVEL